MKFGTSCQTDLQRVAKQLEENNWKDPEPSMLSRTGNEFKVMNLRPLAKSMHVSKDDFRYIHARSQNERF